MSEHPPLQQRKDSKRFGEKDLSSDEIKQQYKPASLKSAKSRIQLIHNEESRNKCITYTSDIRNGRNEQNKN